MKNIQKIIKIFFLLLLVACSENDLRDVSFVNDITAPTNVSAIYNITQDNTGNVTITPNADGAVSFEIFFGDGTETPAIVPQGKNVQHVYAEGTYEVKIVAITLSGVKTEATQQLIVSFKAPQNLVVVIENDVAVSKKVNITANAEYATIFEFSSGESGVSQPVVSGNIGSTISYTYQNAGTFNIIVEAKGGAIATTKYEASFVVTEILAPTQNAPTPPNRSAADVISIFSDVYTNIPNTNFFPNWGQATLFTAFNLNGNEIIQYSNLNYQGIEIGSEVDASSMETLHIDIWSADDKTIDIYPLPKGVQPADERFVKKTLEGGKWNSFDIPMSDFTNQGLPINDLLQFKFVGSGTVFIDNIYFFKATSASTFDDGLLSNGDFQNGNNSWIVGVDDNSPAPVTTASGNTYYSVNVTNAGNAFDVNLSQKLEITDGNTYTLTFDAWSNVNRSIVAGIGLSANPWSNDVKTVDINTTRTTYSVTVSASGWGAANARVIFDLGAQVGEVNLDNVSLFIGNGNLVENGNFENGSTPWIVGVNDNAPAPVVLTNGNNHYSVNVTNAGNAFDVNLSQKLSIEVDATYTLTFDAWSNVDRPILAGIGLSADPWSNTTETVNITTNRTTFTLTLQASGWGATNARVLFDVGAAVGVVNIDNVSLSKN